MTEYLSEQELQLLNPKNIQRMIHAELPVSITTYRLTPEIKQYIRRVSSLFLREIHQGTMEEYINYCLSELMDNSQKANAKRVFFKENNLDIFNQDDYARGMESFKKEFLANQTHYQTCQEESGLSITMSLETRGENLYLEVTNNSRLTVFEYKRIHDRIMHAIQSKDSSQIFSYIDEKEGAGLGFISITLMLKKLGIPVENIQILSQSDKTTVRIRLPKNIDDYRYITAISYEIAEIIKNLPQLPENVSKINRLLNDPTSDIGQIISLIQQDVSLSADLLKLVNSASFRMQHKPTNIEDSVKMVGLRGVKNLIYAIESLQTLTPPTKNKKSLWQHSQQVGNYTLALAYKFYGNNKQITADAYVCGLLHDIGKILFEAAHPDTLQKLSSFCNQKKIPSRIYEKIVAGINHAEIGAFVTKKWNFPDVITAAIEFHHTPSVAPEDHKQVVEIVYLANALYYYEKEHSRYNLIYTDILKKFGIETERQLQHLLKDISA